MHKMIRREEAENYATPEELRLIDEQGGIFPLAEGGTMHRVALGFASRYVHVTKLREHKPAGQQNSLYS